MSVWDRIPTPLKLAGFDLAFIALGTALLMMPFSSKAGLTLSEASFTAMSAVTVTGLSVISAADDLTFIGQAILLFLIQIGGVGLIVVTVAVLSALGARAGIDPRSLLKGDVGVGRRSRLVGMMRRVVKIVILCELAVAALLALAWVPEYGWAQGTWHAVFHAVSAFNHAGFDIFGNSLQDYRGSPYVLIVVSCAFIASSLGFIVYAELRTERHWRLLSLHTKLMISGTLILLLVPLPVFAALEWSNSETLGGLDSFGDKLAASWFAVATPRTAGFAALPTDEMRSGTSFLRSVLMFIGGGSGSTSGGVKITTVAVVLLSAIAFYRKSDDVTVFKTAVARGQVHKAVTLIVVTVLLYLLATFLLLSTQDAASEDLRYEATSALATVGLSRGATGELDGFGRAVIMALMFLGRVGPLTLGYLLAAQRPPLTRYPKGEIHLG